MNKIKVVISLLALLLLIFNCDDKKAKYKNTKSFTKTDTINTLYINVENDSVFKYAEILIDIKDTLYFGKKNFGNLYSIKKLHDSIKRNLKEDLRGVTSCIGINNPTLDYKEDYINEKRCDTFYQTDLDFEKTRIPFYVIPKKEGELFIEGHLKDEIFLSAYKYNDSTETRYLELEYSFKLPVYVKKDPILTPVRF